MLLVLLVLLVLLALVGGLVERVVELGFRDAGLVEREAPAAVAEHEWGHPPEVVVGGSNALLPSGQGRGGTAEHEVCAHTFGADREGDVRGELDHVIGHRGELHTGDAGAKCFVVSRMRRIGLVGLAS